MKQNYLRDQRGVAMLLELVLVAAVLALVGLAIYQSSQCNKTASVQSKPPAPSSANGLAASAAAVAEQESATDASLSASGNDALAGEVSGADSDVTNLGGSYNANAF